MVTTGNINSMPLAPDGNGMLLIQPVGTERVNAARMESREASWNFMGRCFLIEGEGDKECPIAPMMSLEICGN